MKAIEIDKQSILIAGDTEVQTIETEREGSTVIKELGGVGPPGKSAYKDALDNGFVGSLEEWLTSLQGPSAYDLALDNGFVGTQQEWLESLKANIPVTEESAGKLLSNDGTQVIWDTIEDQLNSNEIQWDLGSI